MGYTIYFENKATASAPAQQVVITDQLDGNKVDLDTFGLGPIGFADKQVVPPPGSTEFNTSVDLRPAKNLLAGISAKLDKSTGLVTWTYQSIDPATGLPTDDPTAGFLPPSVNPPEGDGSVVFSVVPKALPLNTQIRNKATIVFDANAPIDTPEWFNTIESTLPASQVLALPALEKTTDFAVRWKGTDTGSGLQDFTIYVSQDGKPYTVWQQNTVATAAVFHGQIGSSYIFYSVASDKAGNVEAAPRTPDATTRIASADLMVAQANGASPIKAGTKIVYRLTVKDKGPDAATGVVLTDQLPAGVQFNSATSTAGRCTQSNGVVTCNLGTLARNRAAQVTITVTPPVGSSLTNVASVHGAEPDTVLTNNQVTQSTRVAPTVTFTAPSDGAGLTALPAVRGTAVDMPGGSAISRVALYLQRRQDSKWWSGAGWVAAKTELATTLSGGTWSRTGSSATPLPAGTDLAEGSYDLTADVFNRGGDRGTSTIHVHVDRTQPGSVTFISPVAGAVIGSLNSVAGTATDNTGGSGIMRVSLFVQRGSDHKYWSGTAWASGERALATVLAPGSGSANWQRSTGLPGGTSLSAGRYSLRAVASDASGNSRTTTISVTVSTTAASVSFTAPTNGATVATLDAVTGQASSGGTTSLSKVALFIQRASDGKFWGSRLGRPHSAHDDP